MKIVKCRRIIVTALFFILIGVLFFVLNQKKPQLDVSKIAPNALIAYNSEYNFRQTVNDCGPFNVAAVVRALKTTEANSTQFAEEIQWRLPNKYTLPWGLENQLEENGIAISTPDVGSFSDEEKMLYLQQELSQNHPIILLGERDEYVGYPYEHYITLLGFDQAKDEFYVYDPFYEKGVEGMTMDSNGEFPGNRTYHSEDLFNFWKGGGMFGLYEWYLIVTSI